MHVMTETLEEQNEMACHYGIKNKGKNKKENRVLKYVRI